MMVGVNMHSVKNCIWTSCLMVFIKKIHENKVADEFSLEKIHENY